MLTGRDHRQMTRAGRLIRYVLLGRRQFNLARWRRSHQFAHVHATTVAWLNTHIAEFERRAPWLHRAGIDVWDYCTGRVRSRFDLSLTPTFRASVGCSRQVTAVYGFDGDLADRLDALAEALAAVGWHTVGPPPMRTRADSGDTAAMRWQPSRSLSYPRGLEGTPPHGSPPLTPYLWASWSSRGQPTGLTPVPGRKRSAARNYLPVELTTTEAWQLERATLEHRTHALAVTISLAYYANRDALALRHRIPRHLIPTVPGR